MRNVSLIGYGAIGAAIVDLWPRHLAGRTTLGSLLVRPGQLAAAQAHAPEGAFVTADPQAFLDSAADVVIEAAGHQAVYDLGEAVLRRGAVFQILSAGALADAELRARLEAAAAAGGGRIVILAGALAGFDGLLSLRAAGLRSVSYTSVKPSEAWRGTPGELLLPPPGDLEPRTVFRGSAAEVCRAFPKNANLAAAVALAGAGFEATQVELVADPRASQNSGRLQAVSDAGDLDVTLVGEGFRENPKTSRITALSVIATLRDAGERIGFH